jgi:glyoxylase-like metal-dependent hydrolase (beta-lactamase superfamily II)
MMQKLPKDPSMPQNQTNQQSNFLTIDLNFLDLPGAIASYLIPHNRGAILIESGPGSTIENLTAGLASHGVKIADISDVFLTHIHLDHAGAAGWFARQGASIHVHPVGAPHLIDPTKLLASAERIYANQMDFLWGEFLNVPESKLSILENNQVLEVGGIQIQAVDTPGHARHHYAYIYEDVCFSGDIGGVRLGGKDHLVVPMPPPELQLEDWRLSLDILQAAYNRGLFSKIAPTHFGIYQDAGSHLILLQKELDDIETWIEEIMPTEPSIDELNKAFIAWTDQRYRQNNLSDELIDIYEAAMPSWMSARGIYRYWRKHRIPQE